VVTNWHVTSNPPRHPLALDPKGATAIFEADHASRRYPLTGILFESETLDCTVLAVKDVPARIVPLPIHDGPLPSYDENSPGLVYIIGYPGGRNLTYSLRDNEVLDHEGPPDGKPPVRTLRRIQYRATTEPGSSGSPVFDAEGWRVLALHHAGHATDMERLNGHRGTWPANEGILMLSIMRGQKPRAKSRR
jgi:V8-like Glu-specific endopeptidase